MGLTYKSSDLVSKQKLRCDVLMYEVTEAFYDENHLVVHNEPWPTNCHVKAFRHNTIKFEESQMDFKQN